MSRVLLTVPSLHSEFGGPVVKATRLAAGLRELGLEVTVAGVGTADGDQVLGLPELGRFHATPIPARLAPLRHLARRSDVVHVIGHRDPVGIVAALAARHGGVPYIWEPAGMHRRRLRSLRLKGIVDRLVGDRVARGAAAVIATSRLEARELESDGVPPGRIRVRPNGVDVDELLPLPERGAYRRSQGIPAEAPVVLCLGRITAKKGLLDLAQALVGLQHVHGVVAGPDDGDGTLQRLLVARGELKLAERLHVTAGGVWGRDRADVFADADAFCLPSASENFGNAALEAAGVGQPVVISSACGAIEFLEPKATRVVEYGDVAGLRTALAEALGETGLRAAARDAAPRIRRALSWATVARDQLAIYSAVR